MHVWAEISKKGATHIVIFSGIMTTTRYAEILSASLVPFIRKHYPEGHRLYQDNDPKHTSRYIQRYFEQIILIGGAFSNLAEVAQKVLCIVATSVPPESLFSTVGNVVTAKRAALDPDNVDKLVSSMTTCHQLILSHYK